MIGKERAAWMIEGLESVAHGMSDEVPEAHRAFRRAAAVLSSYDPTTLKPVGEGFEDQLAISWLLPESERVIDARGKPAWTLNAAIRRRTLRRLGGREAMERALEANPDRPDDPIQRALETLIRGDRLELESLAPDDLAGLLTARDWLDGILPDLPAADVLRRYAGLHRLLAPLRQLADESFRNREEILDALRDYVGVLPSGSKLKRFARRVAQSLRDWPPLFLWGAGGVGKSTVIARFVLDHAAAEGEDRFPFVYLNFDRHHLSADRPLTLLREAVRQIAAQYPDVAGRADELGVVIADALASRGQMVSESPSLSHGEEELMASFAELLEKAGAGERPLLFVLDTFEEVQFLGHDRVEAVWDFLETLQSRLPRLRVVIAGRGRPEGLRADDHQLTELDPGSARELVRALLEQAQAQLVDDELIDRLIKTVGANPLSLKLAAGLVAKDRAGAEALEGLETRRWFGLLRAKAAQVQGMLYGRILDHVHDPEVRQLAYPGLVLRRITPELIERVLAKPCGVKVKSREHAEDLFRRLGEETSLVEPVEDGVLEHRADVRRIVLEDLERQYPEQATEIHRRAVDYYRERPAGDVRARAEEIYHRLRLGEEPGEIEKRWLPGVEEHLTSALEELGPAARRFLGERLGVTPDKELLAQAELDEWERQVARSARRLLVSEKPAKALELFAAREERSEGSPLYALEVEALRLVGRRGEAAELARRGIESASRAGDLSQAAELSMLASLIEEAEGRLESALDAAVRTAEAAVAANSRALELRATVARLRLLRKLGAKAGERELEALRKKVIDFLDRPGSRQFLRRHGTVLREIAAELGDVRLREVKLALRHVGLEVASSRAKEDVVQILERWDDQQRGDYLGKAARIDLDLDVAERGPSRRGKFRGVVDLGSSERGGESGGKGRVWRDWVEQQGPRLGRSVADLLEQVDPSTEVGEAITRQLRDSVDAAIQKVVDH